MKLRRVRDADADAFSKVPELRMGVHLALADDSRPAEPFLVIGQVVAIALSEVGLLLEQDDLRSYLQNDWLQPGCEGRETRFEIWLSRLGEAPPLTPLKGDELEAAVTQLAVYPPTVMGLVITPRSALPAAAARSTVVFGHLPFSFSSDPNTEILRWEPFPVSRRCAAGTSNIRASTFGSPKGEDFFVRCGFAAVGRYALPSLLPTCFCYTLQPTARSLICCGASVPLFGQAGGGVEVMFPGPTTTRAPIMPPSVLPPL